MKRLFSILTGTIFLISCEKLIIPPNENETERNIKDFHEIRRIINTDFPYLDSMKINWDSICLAYEPLVEKAKGDEIDKIFVEMLSNLKDGHTHFISKGVNYTTYTSPRIIKDFNAYSPEVVRRYFNENIKVAGKIEYVISPQNIGYLHLSDFVEGDWLIDLDNALSYFSNTKGMIFDLRNNTGGKTIPVIRRFVDKEMILYIYYSKTLNPVEVKIVPNSITYTKPLVILINGCSLSAAEWAPAFLDQLSNVTLIGDLTAGLDGGEYKYNLPSGKILQTTHEYMLFRGRPFQCIGVTPDILIPQTENDIKQGRDKQLEYAIDFLK
jgi:hypothetical protein